VKFPPLRSTVSWLGYSPFVSTFKIPHLIDRTFFDASYLAVLVVSPPHVLFRTGLSRLWLSCWSWCRLDRPSWCQCNRTVAKYRGRDCIAVVSKTHSPIRDHKITKLILKTGGKFIEAFSISRASPSLITFPFQSLVVLQEERVFMKCMAVI